MFEIRSRRVEMVSPGPDFAFYMCSLSTDFANNFFWPTVYNLLMDFVFALFPWILVWKLDMNKAEKISLCLTLSLGIM